MNSLFYNIKQGFLQIFRNKGMSLASIFSILAMLLILGIFFLIAVNLNLFTEVVKQDYDQVEVGKTPAIFSLDGKEMGRAVVTYKAPSIDPESRTFKFKVLVPKESKLVSGTLCDLTLILTEKEAYGLPADALLLRANDRYIAYAIDGEKRAKSFNIVRGIVDGKYCEVQNATELLNERFVVTGQTFVNNGTLLREVRAE